MRTADGGRFQAEDRSRRGMAVRRNRRRGDRRRGSAAQGAGGHRSQEIEETSEIQTGVENRHRSEIYR